MASSQPANLGLGKNVWVGAKGSQRSFRELLTVTNGEFPVKNCGFPDSNVFFVAFISNLIELQCIRGTKIVATHGCCFAAMMVHRQWWRG